MAARKETPRQYVGNLVVNGVKKAAQDPELHKKLMGEAIPVAVGVGKFAVGAARKVKLPAKSDPFDDIEAALDAIEKLIDEKAQGTVPAETIGQWRTKLTGLRSAVPLAKADEGKGRRTKLRNLRSGQHALLDEVFAAVVTGSGSAE